MAQFVPLKIDTDGDNWQAWSRKYRHEGSAIPILYVVRANGDLAYGKSGSKQGDELPKFLAEHLATAGRIFNDAQLAAIQGAVTDANKALAEGDAGTAVKRLEGLKKLGEPGKFGSFATVALEADALYAKLVEQGQGALKAAQEQLAGNDKFAGVLGIVSANRIYGKLPELRKDLVSAERDLSKDAELKEHIKQAEAVDRALALLSLKNGKKSAMSALETVITRFPNSPAAELAKAKLAELGAAVPAGVDGPVAELRTWSDASGKFQIEATLIGVADGKVQLKKKSGEVVTVPTDKLSKEDQEFLAKK